MSDYTPEPWHIGALESGRVAIDGPNGEEVTGWLEQEEAHRILACVNACAGVSTEVLHRVSVSQTLAENERLREALEAMLHCAHPAYVGDDFLRERLIAAREAARTALARKETT